MSNKKRMRGEEIRKLRRDDEISYYRGAKFRDVVSWDKVALKMSSATSSVIHSPNFLEQSTARKAETAELFELVCLLTHTEWILPLRSSAEIEEWVWWTLPKRIHSDRLKLPLVWINKHSLTFVISSLWVKFRYEKFTERLLERLYPSAIAVADSSCAHTHKLFTFLFSPKILRWKQQLASD